MGTVTEMRTRLTKHLPIFIIALFVIQPLLDVLSFWMAKFQISNTLTLLLRLLVLVVTVLVGFVVSRNKKVYFIAAAVCLVVGIGHIFACWQNGYQNIITDLSNYVRVLQMPLTVLCLISVMKVNELGYGAMQKAIVINMLIILVVQVLAVVTGTEPHTYDDGAGLIGWFSNTNTQSAIVNMIAPVAVVRLYQRKGLKNVWLWIVLVGSCGSMYFLGTRLAYAGIVAMCFGLGCSMLIIRIRDWKKACAFLLVGIIFIALLPVAPMTGHRGGWDKEMEEKQGYVENHLGGIAALPSVSIPPISTEPGTSPEPEVSETPDVSEEPVLTEEEKKIKELEPIYNIFIGDFVAIFGLKETMELYNYTTDIPTLTALRTKKLLFASKLMEDAPLLTRLFGIELDRFTVNNFTYDVENDFHGIYYLYGVVGLVALLVFIAYFLLLIIKALIKNFRRYFTLEAAGWGIALVLCLGYCYFTAGVLRRPSASFYMAATLAAVYYLIKIKKYPDEIEV